MEVCSLIVNTAELAQFAKGCGISDYTVSRAAVDNLGNDGECIEQALCRWWMSSNTHPHHKAHKVKLGFDQLDCQVLFGTLLDRYPELDPRGDEAAAAVEPLPGPSTDPSYDRDNGKKLDMDSHLWREQCFHEAEEKLDKGITTLIMNLATLVTNMDDLKDLADSMNLPRRIATLLLTTYKPVMVTMLQLYTSCSYHMLIVWYWSEMGDEFRKLYNLQKIFDFLGLGSKCVDIMSCHGYGPVDTGMRNLLRSRRVRLTRLLPAQIVRVGQVSKMHYRKLLSLASVHLLGKMGRVWWMEKFLQLVVLQDSKFQKVYLLKILILVKINIQTQRDILLWLDFG